MDRFTAFRSALLLMLTAMFVCTAASQAETPSCNIGELSNRDGWEIPGLSGAEIRLKNSRWTTGGMKDVRVDILKSNSPETSVILVGCVPDRPGRVEVELQPVDVVEILRFKMNDRVFAYRVTLQEMGIEGNERYKIASQMILTYYDQDGSGRFTILRYPGSELLIPLEVPEWVRTPRDREP